MTPFNATDAGAGWIRTLLPVIALGLLCTALPAVSHAATRSPTIDEELIDDFARGPRRVWVAPGLRVDMPRVAHARVKIPLTIHTTPRSGWTLSKETLHLPKGGTWRFKIEAHKGERTRTRWVTVRAVTPRGHRALPLVVGNRWTYTRQSKSKGGFTVLFIPVPVQSKRSAAATVEVIGRRRDGAFLVYTVAHQANVAQGRPAESRVIPFAEGMLVESPEGWAEVHPTDAVGSWILSGCSAWARDGKGGLTCASSSPSQPRTGKEKIGRIVGMGKLSGTATYRLELEEFVGSEVHFEGDQDAR